MQVLKFLLCQELQELPTVVATASLNLLYLAVETDEIHFGFFTWFKTKRESSRKPLWPFWWSLAHNLLHVQLRYFYRITNLEAVEFRFMPLLSVCSYVFSLAEETCRSYSCKCVFFSHNHQMLSFDKASSSASSPHLLNITTPYGVNWNTKGSSLRTCSMDSV